MRYESTCEFIVGHIEDTIVVSRALERTLDLGDHWLLVENLGDRVDFLEMWEATRQYHLNNDSMYMTLAKDSGVHTITFYVSDHVHLQFHFYPPHREKYVVWCGILKSVQKLPVGDMLREVVHFTVIRGTLELLQLPRYETDEEYMLRVERDG